MPTLSYFVKAVYYGDLQEVVNIIFFYQNLFKGAEKMARRTSVFHIVSVCQSLS